MPFCYKYRQGPSYLVDYLTMLSVSRIYIALVDSMINECGAVGGMKIGRGYRNIRRKPAPVSLCPPQIPHELTWDQTRAAAMGNQ
jgi:hypothetical protein